MPRASHPDSNLREKRRGVLCWLAVLTILLTSLGILTWQNAVTSREKLATKARQQAAAEQALQFAYKKGIGTAFTLLPEDLPRLTGITGALTITREIAIAALTNKVSFPLPLLSPEPPAFTPDGRWVIQILTTGDVMFSETVFLNAPKYKLTAQASAVRVLDNTLYVLDNATWTKRRMILKSGAKAALGLPEPLKGQPPDFPAPLVPPPFKIVQPADTTLVVLAAAVAPSPGFGRIPARRPGPGCSHRMAASWPFTKNPMLSGFGTSSGFVRNWRGSSWTGPCRPFRIPGRTKPTGAWSRG